LLYNIFSVLIWLWNASLR